MMNTMFRKMFMLVAFAACAGIANAQRSLANHQRWNGTLMAGVMR